MIKGKKGFTLVEILIVVAIIAILAGAVLVGLAPTRRAGSDARRLSDLRQTQATLELYFNACGGYPQLLGTEADEYDAYTNTLEFEIVSPSCGADLQIDALPHDPRVGTGVGVLGDYGYDSDGVNYVLAALLDGPLPAGSPVAAPSWATLVTECGNAATDGNVYCLTF
jgi:prepilin-type N-terminal cleavage/methylation domain-containing protein